MKDFYCFMFEPLRAIFATKFEKNAKRSTQKFERKFHYRYQRRSEEKMTCPSLQEFSAHNFFAFFAIFCRRFETSIEFDNQN
jgi:hypothetical protein